MMELGKHSREKKKYEGQRGDEPKEDGFLGANAPWFAYDQGAARKPDIEVPLFNGVIHQMSNRIITADVPTPKLSLVDLAQNYNIGLHVQLRAPPGPLSVDRWDRYATFGMFAPDGKGA